MTLWGDDDCRVRKKGGLGGSENPGLEPGRFINCLLQRRDHPSGLRDPQAGAPDLLGVLHEYACGGLGPDVAQRTPAGASAASRRQPMNNPG